MRQNKSIVKDSEFFLPDFCQVESLFVVILIGEILAIVFTLLNFQLDDSMWRALGLYSISVQIISLISVTALCWLRPLLQKFSDSVSGGLSLLIILMTTFAFSLSVITWYWWSSIDLERVDQKDLIVRNLVIAGLIGGVALRYLYLQQQYRKQTQLELSARLEALQARIRPHFLFNSMNVIASLTRIDPEKAEAAIEDLSDLFRATLENNEELVPFSQELQNGERYLSIEKIRLGDRLKVVKSIDPKTLETLIPPLSLQPILENAVYHGIQMIADGGEVEIKSSIETRGDKPVVLIEVINPKCEYDYNKGHGIALENIAQRLAVIYRGQAKLTTKECESFFKVTMRVPLSAPVSFTNDEL